MNENSGIAKYMTDLALSVVDQVVNGNGPKLMNSIFFGALGIVWIYCGIKVYLDARQRFKSSFPVQVLFLIFGIITGPLGLILYNSTKPKFTREEMDFIGIEHKFYFHQASKILDCLHCDSYVLEGQAFCTNCGTQNRFKCENCQHLSDYDDKFCSDCGVNLPDRLNEMRSNHIKKLELQQKKINPSGFLPALKNMLVNPASKVKQVFSNVASGTKSLVGKVNLQQSEREPVQTTEIVEDSGDHPETVAEPLPLYNPIDSPRNKNLKKKHRKK
jgi:hypothetical protein